MQDFIIAIDTREQRPYDFKNIKPESPKVVTQTLKTGDYSLVGLENKVCVERKSLVDIFGSIGAGRARFEREMIRMSEIQYAVLVIESSLSSIFVNPPRHTKMNPKSVFRTLIAWSQRYNIHVWPMWNRDAAEKVTYLILKRFYDDYVDGKYGN